MRQDDPIESPDARQEGARTAGSDPIVNMAQCWHARRRVLRRPRRATCRACGVEYAVNLDGTLRYHKADWLSTCFGSGQRIDLQPPGREPTGRSRLISGAPHLRTV